MNLILLIVFFLWTTDLAAQADRVKGFRLYGKSASHLPVASLDGEQFVVEFDVMQAEPPNLYFQFVHCDKNWKATSNLFVNDPIKLRTRFPLPYRLAPEGVENYRYHYEIALPAEPLHPAFSHSGNYILELRDGTNDKALARGKFFVVEKRIRPDIRLSNRSLPANVNPYDQALQIDVRFALPEIDSATRETYYPFNLRTVDIIRNREVERTWRIDVDDANPETSVDGISLRRMTFTIYDLPVGTEYRQIDLRNVTDYPAGRMLRARQGPDVSRFQQRPLRDADGAATYRSGDRYADYLPFQFELLWDSPRTTVVHVVGDFNGWHVKDDSRMSYEGGRFVWKTWLRRGVYDYQYVVGADDWIALEGNDWRSVSNYTAFVYYRDTRYGGFDRILGTARARNSGAFQSGSFD